MALPDTPTRVRQTIASQLARPFEDCTDDTTFASLGADSLDGIELAMALEDKFEIQIEDGEIEEADTVGAAIAVVEKALAGNVTA